MLLKFWGNHDEEHRRKVKGHFHWFGQNGKLLVMTTDLHGSGIWPELPCGVEISPPFPSLGHPQRTLIGQMPKPLR
jgi:hypothetical protein